MHERDAILRLLEKNENSVLATVVEVKGSAYRRAGARMLLVPGGASAGVINGGCLDADLRARADVVMERGEAQLAVYDSTSPEDIVFGLGLGCRGVVKILLEPACPLGYLSLRPDETVAVATVFECEQPASSSVPCTFKLGARAAWRKGAGRAIELEANTLPANEELTSQIACDAYHLLQNGASFCRDYQSDTVKVRAFIELIAPPQNLTIFGAGADVVGVAAMARLLGWHVNVFDMRAPSPSRPSYIDSTHLPLDGLQANLEIAAGSACLVMSHNFLTDLELLKVLLPSQASYIGVLGPRRRTEELLEKIGADTLLPGIQPTPEQLTRLHAPVGLDIGAETPEEIALSIISEIQMKRRQKTGDSLREKRWIH